MTNVKFQRLGYYHPLEMDQEQSAAAGQDAVTRSKLAGKTPIVRSIRPVDLKNAFNKGLDDFLAMPTHVFFLSLIYPVVCFGLAAAIFEHNLVPDLYPIAAGFPLIGSFAAIGIYELSRRRELGLGARWNHVFDFVHSKSLGAIVTLGLLFSVIFVAWVAAARAIFVMNLGDKEIVSLTEFAQDLLTTPQGRNVIIVGNAVGFLFAVLVFSLSVVSVPLLLDRNVGVAVAVLTSVRVVLKNPITMALWGLFVACSLLIGSLAFFCGLAIVMPVLGHSTWHLYRRVVEPDMVPRPEYCRGLEVKRYAADFPAVLFSSRNPWRRSWDQKI
jgi:uncharacterized membrane protein